MKIAQIAGFLGSGKTTFLIEVAKELVSAAIGSPSSSTTSAISTSMRSSSSPTA